MHISVGTLVVIVIWLSMSRRERNDTSNAVVDLLKWVAGIGGTFAVGAFCYEEQPILGGLAALIIGWLVVVVLHLLYEAKERRRRAELVAGRPVPRQTWVEGENQLLVRKRR